MPSKRVNIVSCKLVRECPSITYAQRYIRQPEDAVSLFNSLTDADREMMMLLCLDRKGQPNYLQTVSIGTLNSSIVHPRELYKAAILSCSCSIIIAHNHPSGDTTPSREDLEITKRIKAAGELLGIELMDHIIIGANSHYSFKSKGNL